MSVDDGQGFILRGLKAGSSILSILTGFLEVSPKRLFSLLKVAFLPNAEEVLSSSLNTTEVFPIYGLR